MIETFRPRRAPGLASCAFLLLASFAGAVETKSWKHSGQADFEKGALENLSLSSDGRLTLAPVFRELADPSVSYLWALAADSKGNLYAGGGSPSSASAKLVAIDAAGKSRTLAELPGLQIQAIAVDKQDRVYAATAPDGKVYRVDPATGKFDTFYDPKAKYIWSMAFNSRGDLFLGTGDGGEVHRVTADGKGAVFFRTEETHARSLAVDGKDNIVVGTEPGGLILRISPAGEGFVVYQADRREVTSVAVNAAGVIYAAAIGAKPSTTSSATPASQLSISAPPIRPASQTGGTVTAGSAPVSLGPVSALPSPPSTIAGGSEVYRIATDNSPQRIWDHAQEIVYAIGFDSQGRAVLGTGNKGHIYRIDSDLVSTLLINAAPTQVTAFAAGSRGRLYAATGNVGKVYQVGPELHKSGSYESEAMDAQSFSYWGRVRHKGEAIQDGVRVETRSGNLDRPQKNWSAWAPLDAAGRVASPSARFLQYRLRLTAAGQGGTPEVREMELAYMPKNVAPVFEDIDVTPPNYKFAAPSLPLTSTNSITLPALGARRRPTASPPPISLNPLSSSSSSATMSYAKGSIGVRWAVNDANGDELVFKAEIRGVQERDWKLLRDKVKERFVGWESNTFPDGEYVVRVTASDAPANPPDQALTASIESERFAIDNTPPRVTALAGARAGDKVTARWRANDERSVIEKAEYSINGGDWVVVQPTTRLSDAQELQYELTVDASGAAAERTIAVRVTDEFHNVTVEKVVVR